MIKYTIEQKVALIKKMELYRLEKNLSYPKMAKLLNCNTMAVKYWEQLKSLPKTQACFQIERVLTGYTPSLHLENLDADYIAKCVEESKKRLYKSQSRNKSNPI